MLRFLLLLLAGVGGSAASGPGDTVPGDFGHVEVIEVSGLLDDATLRFLMDAIDNAATEGAEVAIVQLNSPAAIGELEVLEAASGLLASPPLPLVMWLGPAPATAGGGAAQLLASADHVAAAPGTRIENWSPAIAGTTGDLVPPSDGFESPYTVTATSDLIDRVAPSIRQLIQDLDGETFVVGGREATISTITAAEDGDGVTTVPTTFTQPGLLLRFAHLSLRPEATFFFLAIGLTVAAFEFYAVGPGLAAVAAALALLLGSFGLAVLPVNWWAVAGAITALLFLTMSYQRGGVVALTALGGGLLLWSGFNFSGGEPQVRTGIPGVILTALAVFFFYLLAIPTMGRARFSTRTIGRAGLVGRRGLALTDFGPEGVVEVDGARWPAAGHREARIKAGAEIVVTAVRGWELEIEPGREN